jgi:hypothetical protein
VFVDQVLPRAAAWCSASDPRGRDQSFARAQGTNPVENKLAAAFPAVFRRIGLPRTVIVLLPT